VIGNTLALWQRAQLYASRQEWSFAKAEFKKLLARDPNHIGALLQLSYIESIDGSYRSAREYALRAFKNGPCHGEQLVELCARLRSFNQAEALFECAEWALQPPPRLQTLLQVSMRLSELNEPAKALKLLEAAAKAWPKQPIVNLVLGDVLTQLGRFVEARSALQSCIAAAPTMATAYWALARLRNARPDDNEVPTIRRLIGQRMSAAESIFLKFALHKELDDLRDFENSKIALREACAAKRTTLRYSTSDALRLFEALHQSALDRPSSSAGSSSRQPIFIVGMHRSGTTLLEQLLDGHSDVRGVGELYDFTSQMRYATDHHCRGVIDLTIVERSKNVDFALVGEGYLEGMEWRLGKEKYFTDKLPSNFLNIGFICQALPQAKILHMVRDPIETCFSNLRELFSDANPYSYDQLELADFYTQYRRLMAHWHQVYPGRILDVDYAELTRDTEPVLRRVSVFCGFDFEPEMLALQNRKRGVATASAVQVRNKIVAREQPKWKPYEQYLQPLIQALRSDGFVQ